MLLRSNDGEIKFRTLFFFLVSFEVDVFLHLTLQDVVPNEAVLDHTVSAN